MSVNFNAILGGGSTSSADFPLTMSITFSCVSRNNETGAMSTLDTQTLVSTISKDGDNITASPATMSTTGKYAGSNTTSTANILAISITGASRSVDNGIYLVNKNDELTVVNFGEYQTVMRQINDEKANEV